MTREEWLRDTSIRKQIRDAKVILYQKSTKTKVYVESNWLHFIEVNSNYNIDNYINQLINLCWSEVSPKSKTMIINYVTFGEDEKYSQDTLPEKYKRK